MVGEQMFLTLLEVSLINTLFTNNKIINLSKFKAAANNKLESDTNEQTVFGTKTSLKKGKKKKILATS